MADRFAGHDGRECGEHRTTGGRAWCFTDQEWCYPEIPCRGCELPSLRKCVERAERELEQTQDAVRLLAFRWLGPDFQRAYGDALLAVLDNPEGYLQMRAASDRPEDAPPKPCPLGYRLHRPHTWTDGGPIHDCPGVTDQPEDAR